jgi:aspartokinase
VEKVGRGYSDLTAALTAADCGAQTLQVWKESDCKFEKQQKNVSDINDVIDLKQCKLDSGLSK